MGFDLARVVTAFGNNDNQDWLSTAHGTTECDSITLDPAAMLAGFANGEVPSGVEMSQRADGRYGPADKTATTGDIAVGRRTGFLLHSVKVTAGINSVGALYWHGQVIAAKVPLGTGAVAPVAASHRLVSVV